MTSSEMKYAVLLGVDSIFENAAPGYNNLQIENFLNKAQRRIFNTKKKIYDIDETVKRMLSPLNKRGSFLEGDIVLTINTDLTDYTHPNGTLYSLPEDVGFIVEEYVKFLTAPATHSNPIPVFPITYDYYTKNYDSRYKKPYEKMVWRLDYSTETIAHVPPAAPTVNYVVELITDGINIIGDYVISYLRFPVDIEIGVADCEILDSNFQDEVVSEAIKMIVAALNDEGYQVAMNEKNSDL